MEAALLKRPSESPGPPRARFSPHTPFRSDLRRRVEAHLRELGIEERGGLVTLLNSLFVLTWFCASYLALVFWAETVWQAIPLACSFSFAFAGIGFMVMHAGGHGSASRHPWVNRLHAWGLDLLGGSSYVWHLKHNVAHHTYTNLDQLDDDLEARPFLRMSPLQPRAWYHRWQHVYVWLLYAFFAPKWWFVDDFTGLRGSRIGGAKVVQPRGLDAFVLVAGKLFFVGYALVIPLMFHSWPIVLGFFVLCGYLIGLTLATAFQLAHCVGEAEFLEPPASGKIEKAWTHHQLDTTVNFAPHSRFLTWYLGGLNYQVEHHLFPQIADRHYPTIAPIVRATCAEHGMPYKSHPTAWGALRSHVRLLRQLGRA